MQYTKNFTFIITFKPHNQWGTAKALLLSFRFRDRKNWPAQNHTDGLYHSMQYLWYWCTLARKAIRKNLQDCIECVFLNQESRFRGALGDSEPLWSWYTIRVDWGHRTALNLVSEKGLRCRLFQLQKEIQEGWFSWSSIQAKHCEERVQFS